MIVDDDPNVRELYKTALRFCGFDVVLAELRAHEATRAIPVIVVTGADVSKATLQAKAILRKPILPEQVIPLIDRVLQAA